MLHAAGATPGLGASAKSVALCVLKQLQKGYRISLHRSNFQFCSLERQSGRERERDRERSLLFYSTKAPSSQSWVRSKPAARNPIWSHTSWVRQGPSCPSRPLLRPRPEGRELAQKPKRVRVLDSLICDVGGVCSCSFTCCATVPAPQDECFKFKCSFQTRLFTYLKE